MSMGPLGALGGAAGSPYAQRTDSERKTQDTNDQQRQVYTETKAEAAEGVGETDGDDSHSEERDADGRRLFEPPTKLGEQAGQAEDDTDAPSDAAQGRDPTGNSGNALDLSV